MLKHNLILTMRNLKRNRFYSIIIIIGLSIGFASCFLIMSYVLDEISYDSFHHKSDRIFRLTWNSHASNTTHAKVNYNLGSELVQDYSEVENYVRFYNFWGVKTVTFKEKIYNEAGFIYTNPALFKVFSFDFLHGNPEKVFQNPGSVVITDRIALKYFGDENPIGEIITLDNNKNVTVSGVVYDLPHNSHFHYDFYLYDPNYIKMFGSMLDGWGFQEFTTYILLKEGADEQLFKKKTQNFISKKYALDPKRNKLDIQALNKVHLYSSEIEEKLASDGDIKLYIPSLLLLRSF